MKSNIDAELIIYGALAIIILIGSCASHKNENICKGATRLKGEVVSVIPHGNFRTVTLQTDTGKIKVYDVPYDQPIITEIPACVNKKGDWVWVMP